jgi:predicted component of type VI protein secretion system
MAIESRLEVVEGSEKGLAIALGGAPVTIGRAPGNGLIVKDAAVSRQHARIFERDGRHFVADLNSSHGTFVNGTKVTLQELHAGDELKLGATLFRYGEPPHAEPPHVEPPRSEPSRIRSPTIEPPKDVAAPKSLPPINTSYRRALDESGEDPFALELPPAAPAAPLAPAPPPEPAVPIAPAPTRIPAASSPSFAPPPSKEPEAAPPIEFRGRTAEQFATRGAAPTASTAARTTGTHVPPPLSVEVRRRRGPLSFLRDELDQRGLFARAVATLFALAVAGGVLWLTLQLTAGPSRVRPPDENAPSGPERPTLPPRHE